METGVTEYGLAVEPVFHVYVVPPEAVSTAVLPAQIVGELTVMLAVPPMVTVATAVPVQPLLVPVTV